MSSNEERHCGSERGLHAVLVEVVAHRDDEAAAEAARRPAHLRGDLALVIGAVSSPVSDDEKIENRGRLGAESSRQRRRRGGGGNRGNDFAAVQQIVRHKSPQRFRQFNNILRRACCLCVSPLR